MMLLHSHKLIKGDLKPENVLIDDDYKPHLTDFCLIKIFESGLSKNPCGGTAAYMAPEVITSDILNEKTDVYSFGILMFEVVTGTRAYAERSNKGFISAANLLMKVINGFRPIFSTEVKPTLKQMIEECWSEDPNNRPTFSEIYNKLSLTEDGYFNDSKSKNSKSIIEGKNDDEMLNLSNKFCFDDVDVQKLFSYITEISDETRVEKNDEEMESLKKEIEKQKKEIESLKKEINKMKNYQNQSENQFKNSTENEDKLTDFQQVADSKMEQNTKKVKEKINQTKNEEKQQARAIIVVGNDGFNQLGEKPNNKNVYGYLVISPHLNLSLDFSSLLSYSVYGYHSVLVTRGGSLLGIGDNRDGKISSSLTKTEISQFTEFSIKDDSGRQLAPISAVCSESGTLYMFSKISGDGRQLVYCDKYINGGDPVFLDIGDEEPVSLFGGLHVAAISDKGEVIIINRSAVKNSPNSLIVAVSLPDGEKASSVTWLKDSVFVLSSLKKKKK